jgi:hypothetical protein
MTEVRMLCTSKIDRGDVDFGGDSAVSERTRGREFCLAIVGRRL